MMDSVNFFWKNYPGRLLSSILAGWGFAPLVKGEVEGPLSLNLRGRGVDFLRIRADDRFSVQYIESGKRHEFQSYRDPW